MSSIFDGLTVSAPALGADNPRPQNTDAPGQTKYQPAVAAAAAARMVATVQQPIGTTGLMARVEPDELVRLLTQAGTGIVLYTPQIGPTPQRVAIDRYVASISGIVFVTLASKALRFPPGVQVVSTTAVLCDGRPLSHQDNMQ